MFRGISKKFHQISNKKINDQIDNMLKAAGMFPFLGVLSTDPTTTGWGVDDICWWVNNSTDTAVVIKYWNGAAVKSVTVA